MNTKAILDASIDWMLSHRVITLCAVLLLAAVCMSGMRSIQFSTDYRVFFGGNDPHLDEYLRQQKVYSIKDNILIAIEPVSEDIFNYETLKVIRRYTHEAWLLPEVMRVDSITNFQDSFSEDNVVYIQDLVGEDIDFSQALLKYVKQVSLTEPALKNRLVSANGKYTGIALTVQIPEGPDKNAKIINLVKAARELAAKIESEPEVAAVYMSGTVMINNAFYEVAKQDLVTLVPIMFLVIIFFMTLLIRSFYATMIVFTMVGLSVGVAFGLGALFGIQLTPPSAAAAPIVMMLVIADAVHILMTYYHKLQGSDYASRLVAMQQSLKINFVPVFLTSATTIIGFLTMNFSNSPPFRDMGNMVAVGVFSAYILALTLLPVCIVSLPGKPRSEETVMKRWMGNLAEFVIKFKAALIALTIILTCVLFLFVTRNELNDEFVKYFDESIKFRTDNDFITQNLTGVYQIEYSIAAEMDGGISSPIYLKTVEAFAEWFRQQPHVMHVQSVTDVYKKAHMNLQDGRLDQYRIPDDRETAAQALLVYEMSLPLGLDLNDQINVSKTETKFIVSLATIPAKELINIEKSATDWVNNNVPPEIKVSIASGPAVLFSHIGMRSIKSGLLSGVVALILICVLISLAFRSFKIGLISLVPNLIPAAMAFGVWGITYGQINMALATVISMTLGIIVDDTIHFIARYRAAQAQGLHTEDAVRETFRSVGSALVVTSIILVCGFAVLTFSPFVMNWGMGLLSLITIVFALFADLFFLPAFLMFFDRKTPRQAPLVASGV